MALVATLVYGVGIAGLFWLDRERGYRSTPIHWFLVLWLAICGSRPVSGWLQMRPIGSPDQYLEGSPIDRNAYLALMLVGIGILVQRQAKASSILRRNPALLCYFIYCAISCFWSDYPLVALKRWSKSLSDPIIVLILLTERDSLTAIRRVLADVAFILIPSSILMIRYYPDMARYYSIDGRQFVSGVTDDKNMLGMICLVYGLAAWWRVLTTLGKASGGARTRQLICHVSIVAMAIWLLWKADSMTSIGCFGLIAGVMGISLKRRSGRIGSVHWGAAAAIAVSFSAVFLQMDGGIFQTMGRDPTLTGRTGIWTLLIGAHVNSWIGAGFESFWLGERMSRLWAMDGLLNGINQAHNGYLETFLNLGAVGVAALSAIIFQGYVTISKRLCQDNESGTLALGLFLAAIIYNFTEAAFKTLCPVWVYFLLATTRTPGLLARLAHRAENRSETPGWRKPIWPSRSWA
jgi:hypothetical protein